MKRMRVSKSWMAAPCQSPHGGNELMAYDACDPTVSGGPALVTRQASSAPPAGPLELSTTSSSTTGSGRTATEARALKVHSEAERRRRVRINAHLTALRRMIPDTKQMDKAALLGRVVDQVRHLKRRASEVAQQTPAVPPETDEVSVEFCCAGDADDDNSRLYIKASVSCDDRPDLVAGLIQALHGLRLRTLRAEVSSLGGRVQHVFTLCKEEEGSAGSAGLNSLKEAVRLALAKVASPELVCGGSPFQFQSKRQRILELHYSIMSI
ncbi:putative transcription factor bHLH107 [Aegilops tauschii subsp. strangulata]|uniref:BHLH domain-containing protein n=4 Tax=Aegilops tauschii subsp. strangulata TaxID=200361 RepID=A0A453E559_AEGTS|nr:putative transcription factor bHLH107 [Aegilops tauschii subsp. strangulata]